MPLDPSSDQAAVFGAAQTAAGSTAVEEEFPDGYLLGVQNGIPTPYYVIDFGSTIAAAEGRSLAPGEQAQPTTERVIITAVSSSKAESRAMSNAMLALTGFKSSSNTGELRLVGGGGFTLPSTAAGRPTLYAKDTFWMWASNMDPDLT